jgi:hypothetical protein
VLPILKHLWSMGTDLVITFVSKSSYTTPRIGIDEARLGKTVALLAADKTLDIKRFARFPWLINHIAVLGSGLGGEVGFFPPRNAGKMDYRGLRFHFSEEGDSVESDEAEIRPLHVLDFMLNDRDVYTSDRVGYRNDRIGKALLNSIVPRSQEYTYDFVNDVMIPDLSRVLRTNKQLRERVAYEMRRSKTRAFAIAREPKASFIRSSQPSRPGLSITRKGTKNRKRNKHR